MARSHRRHIPLLVLLVLAIAVAWPWTPIVEGQDSDLSGTPQSECGPGSDPETAEQGRVPAADYESGRTDRPYTCNTELVGSHGATGGYKVHRYIDAQGQECAYYDSTLLFPTDLLTQLSEGAGVIVLDMTDPANPVMTAQLTTPAMLSPHESLELNQARGLLAAVAGNPVTFPGIVDVYDVSQDCTSPVLQASAPVGFLGHESGFAPDGMTFYTAATSLDSVVAIDLTNPRVPTPVAFIPVQSHGIQVSDDGKRLYTTPLEVGNPLPILPTTGALRAGIGIVDVSQVQSRQLLPSTPVISELTWPEASIPQTAIPVTIDGDPYLVQIDEFVSFRDIASAIDGTPGVGRIIDISDETAPRVVSNFRLDVHDPAIRRPAGLAADPGFSFAQGYAGHYCAVPQREDPGIVACSMILSGLRVFDIRDPEAPVEIAYFNTAVDGAPYAMSAPAFVPERSEIWYSDGSSGFHVVRLTNDVWPFAEDDGEVEVQRLSGETRIETAIAASQDTFADGAADVVVLARADEFADALAGGPLAVAGEGPILLTGRDTLHPATAAEIDRVLSAGGVVQLLGGTEALSEEVANAAGSGGRSVVRFGGVNRFETAAIIAADGLGDPDRIVVADGTTFGDAVVAAPVAAGGGALLLSDGQVLPPETTAYLADREGSSITAIGVAASTAVTDPDARRIDGTRSGEVSVDVAEEVFPGARLVGIARRDQFADALTAGAVLGRSASGGGPGPVLLVDPDNVPSAVRDLLQARASAIRRAVIFGGPVAVSPAVASQIEAALR